MVNSVLTILNYSSLLDFFTPLKRVLQIFESEFKTTTKLKEAPRRALLPHQRVKA